MRRVRLHRGASNKSRWVPTLLLRHQYYIIFILKCFWTELYWVWDQGQVFRCVKLLLLQLEMMFYLFIYFFHIRIIRFLNVSGPLLMSPASFPWITQLPSLPLCLFFFFRPLLLVRLFLAPVSPDLHRRVVFLAQISYLIIPVRQAEIRDVSLSLPSCCWN